MNIKKLEQGIISFGKAMPLVGGASVGLLCGGLGGKSPIDAVQEHDLGYAAKMLVLNYTGFNPFDGKFYASGGIGAKGLVGGALVKKSIEWILE